MNMTVTGIAVAGVDAGLVGNVQMFDEQRNHRINLIGCGEFILTPTQQPMVDRVGATAGLLGNGDHFGTLSFDRFANETSGADVEQAFCRRVGEFLAQHIFNQMRPLCAFLVGQP
ncbi:hypothetical protein ASE82_16960 [Sphingomonas sp. Leaf230]|nr:hypothetical protein ASE82_16960 [Sphingomonas sp. Leaf230]